MKRADIATELAARLERARSQTITCADESTLILRAGEAFQCAPRSQKGPWVSVEVVANDASRIPRSWASRRAGGEGRYGYVPVDLVVRHIYRRGGFQ